MELTRSAYARALVDLGHENPNVVVLDADLSQSTLTKYFAQEFPERFFEMGIAEQDMVTTAAGLSKVGFIPFISSYAIFLTGRAWDQVRNTVDYSECNVKIAAAHGGISVGKDGPTHQSMEDLGNMLSLVNMTVLVPCDHHETYKITKWAADYRGPVYFRQGREKTAMLTAEETPFEHGRALEVVEGNDGTIIATGLMLPRAVMAAYELAREGIFPRVLNMATLKPIDEPAILQAARETGAIITAEEHSIYGGLGSVVARIIVEHFPVPMKVIAIPNMYLTSGPPEDLLVLAGLTADNIARSLRECLR
jgi:transketolase